MPRDGDCQPRTAQEQAIRNRQECLLSLRLEPRRREDARVHDRPQSPLSSPDESRERSQDLPEAGRSWSNVTPDGLPPEPHLLAETVLRVLHRGSGDSLRPRALKERLQPGIVGYHDGLLPIRVVLAEGDRVGSGLRRPET